MIEDVQWFTFQSIVLHTANIINSPEDHLKSLLKVFSMFMIRIWYDETMYNKNYPYAIGIKCINFGKTIVCLLDNKTVKNFITTFVTNMVFLHVGLSWIFQPNQKLNFDLQHHCIFLILNGPWYDTAIC